MSEQLPYDPKGHYAALKARMDANAEAEAKIPVNVHYSTAAGSDPVVMGKIEDALKAGMPFGLKCQRSSVVFIPHKLKAYWIWSDGEHGPVFQYADATDMVTGVKLQYLAHKEFIPTAELAAMAKIILFQTAIDNVESWQRKILP